LARVRDGDRIRVDAVAGTLTLVGDAAAHAEFAARIPATAPDDDFARFSMGRGLFGLFRRHARIAEEGGSALDLSEADAAPAVQTAGVVAQ
jgi:phosphogluconate dehydratase